MLEVVVSAKKKITSAQVAGLNLGPMMVTTPHRFNGGEGILLDNDTILLVGGTIGNTGLWGGSIYSNVTQNKVVTVYKISTGVWYSATTTGEWPFNMYYRNYHLIGNNIWHVGNDAAYKLDLATFTWFKVNTKSLNGTHNYSRSVLLPNNKIAVMVNPRSMYDDKFWVYDTVANIFTSGVYYDPNTASNVCKNLVLEGTNIATFGQDDGSYYNNFVTQVSAATDTITLVDMGTNRTGTADFRYSTVVPVGTKRYLYTYDGIFNITGMATGTRTFPAVVTPAYTKTWMSTVVYNPSNTTCYVFGGSKSYISNTMDAPILQTFTLT